MYKYNTDYKRTTQSTAFSLPLTLLDDLIETLKHDSRFKNRSELATKLFSDYVESRREETERLRE